MKQQLDRLLDQVSVVESARCERCGGLGVIFVVDDPKTRHEHVEACPKCGPQCDVCGGMGFVRYGVPVDDARFGKLFPCPQNCTAVTKAREDRLRGLRKYSKLPAEYEPLTFDTFDSLPEIAREGKMPARWAAEMFVAASGDQFFINRADVARFYGQDAPDDWRNWLVFYGEHGRGKTGLAAAIVNSLMVAGASVLYLRLQDYIEAVQKRYDRERARRDGYDDEFGDTVDSVQEMAKSAPVLVVDEFDVPQLSDNKRDIVERVIRYRHGERLPTVITTNLIPKAFEARWGATIASVVRARAHWIEVGGPTLRPVENHWSWQ